MEKVVIDFFQFARDGITFVFEDEQDNPLDPLDIWESIELAFFNRLDGKTPILVKEPLIDDNIVSVVFSTQELKQYFQGTAYRVQVRAYSGSDYEVLFPYEIQLKNVYNL